MSDIQLFINHESTTNSITVAPTASLEEVKSVISSKYCYRDTETNISIDEDIFFKDNVFKINNQVLDFKKKKDLKLSDLNIQNDDTIQISARKRGGDGGELAGVFICVMCVLICCVFPVYICDIVFAYTPNNNCAKKSGDGEDIIHTYLLVRGIVSMCAITVLVCIIFCAMKMESDGMAMVLLCLNIVASCFFLGYSIWGIVIWTQASDKCRSSFQGLWMFIIAILSLSQPVMNCRGSKDD